MIANAQAAATLVRAPEIRFLAASAAPTSPIEKVLTAQPVTFPSPVRNFKLSLVFDQPLAVSKVSIESCAKDWADGIQVFTSPGLGRVFVEGGKPKLEAKLTAKLTQSIAFVFGHETELCLKNLKIFDQKDQPMELKVTESVKANVSPNGERLFDSHPETEIALGEPVKIAFDDSQKFDRAFVSTSGSPLYAHSLKLTGEKGWSEILPLRNSPSAQEVIFKKPYSGKQLTITAPDAGEIGELRFGLGTKVESVQINKVLAPSVFDRALDFVWVTGADTEDKWSFLFRADGTFFIRGYSDDQKQAHDYSALGAYTIVRQTPKQLRLKINGIRFATGLAWDGVSCPFSCGTETSLEGAGAINDSLVFEKLDQKSDDGSIMIRNRTPRSQRTLTFGDLKVHRSGDD